ncbi:MAG: IS1634 family transposase [Bacteroidales bacterium]
MKIRVVNTGSGARAVQVIKYRNNKRFILKHIGSAHTDKEVEELKILANEWIKSYTGQLSLIEEENLNQFLHLTHCSFLGVRYDFFYQTINLLHQQVGFHDLPQILHDLATIRIFEPASKVRSFELLDLYFGVIHNRKNYYKITPDTILLKSLVEDKVIDFAREHYSFNFDLLFYDVTTLYFETFTEDELRENGFSKDNKLGQPQILIALMVSKEGFPLNYEIFSGSTFEGHTLIPVITSFIKKHQVKEFTVVADAAMISDDNIKQLLNNKINYIVGARLGNISNTLLDTIDKNLPREDGKTHRIPTDKGYLICSFSSTRYRKDKYEMEKQIEKAKHAVKYKFKNKRFKFISTINEKRELNQKLIEKTIKLLGIKGYYTNLKESTTSNQIIIDRYHELYKIEQAFRISKHDLQTRPIFHFKEEPIKLHILICFMALVISKHIELQSGISIRKFINEAKKITDGLILNKITNKIHLVKN